MSWAPIESARRSLEYADQHNYSGVTVRKDALRELLDHYANITRRSFAAMYEPEDFTD